MQGPDVGWNPFKRAAGTRAWQAASWKGHGSAGMPKTSSSSVLSGFSKWGVRGGGRSHPVSRQEHGKGYESDFVHLVTLRGDVGQEGGAPRAAGWPSGDASRISAAVHTRICQGHRPFPKRRNRPEWRRRRSPPGGIQSSVRGTRRCRRPGRRGRPRFSGPRRSSPAPEPPLFQGGRLTPRIAAAGAVILAGIGLTLWRVVPVTAAQPDPVGRSSGPRPASPPALTKGGR